MSEKVEMLVGWTEQIVAGFRVGTVVEGDWQGCPCVGSTATQGLIVFF